MKTKAIIMLDDVEDKFLVFFLFRFINVDQKGKKNWFLAFT